MNPEDLGRFFEEAFEKIEPKDERQRQKLHRFREMMQSSNEDLARALANVRKETERTVNPPQQEETLRLSAERARIAREATDDLLAACDEHAGLLARIVAATRE